MHVAENVLLNKCLLLSVVLDFTFVLPGPVSGPISSHCFTQQLQKAVKLRLSRL